MAYKRKTVDVYEMHSNYGYGWECEVTEDSWKDLREQLKCYRENCPNGQFKAVVRRERIEVSK